MLFLVLYFLHCMGDREHLDQCDEDLAWVNVCLAKAYIELGDVDEAKYFILRADSVYKDTPGQCHPYYVEDFMPLFRRIINLRCV